MQIYDRNYYLAGERGSKRSAEIIIPIVLELVRAKSVVDVGCGVGEWLSVFAKHGINDFLGVDGEWVKKLLQIPENHFVSHDLTQPFRMNRKFDLVVSVEVAEHLPNQCAEIFVDSLVSLGPVVLFSAAIPFQGGPPTHVNEQWPDYWTKLFKKRGYVVVDPIRRRIWQNNGIEPWYAQNTLIFVDWGSLAGYPLLKEAYESTFTNQLSIVHPKIYLARCEPRNLSLRQILPMLPIAFKNALGRRLRTLAHKNERNG